MCDKCDNSIISSYESYASNTFFAAKLESNHFENENGTEFTRFSNIDYCKFKLFLLSLLWRSSISSRPFFSNVQLGKHEEIIRKMILTNSPGDIEDYPVFLVTYLNDKSIPPQLIRNPFKLRFSTGQIAYRFLIGGMFYIFLVNSKNHKLPEFISTVTIKPSNEIDIYHLPKGIGFESIFK